MNTTKLVNDIMEFYEGYENNGNGLAYDYFINLSIKQCMEIEKMLKYNLVGMGNPFKLGNNFKGVHDYINMLVQTLLSVGMLED